MRIKIKKSIIIFLLLCLVRELFLFSIKDDYQEDEVSIPHRNLLMILKMQGLSNKKFQVIEVIGANLGDKLHNSILTIIKILIYLRREQITWIL